MSGYDYGLVTILCDLDQMVPNAATEKVLLILRIPIIYMYYKKKIIDFKSLFEDFKLISTRIYPFFCP